MPRVCWAAACAVTDRHPHLVQAHLIPAHAAEIDQQSFELALGSLIAGLEAAYTSVADPQQTIH